VTEVDQLGLFAAAPEPVQEAAEAGRFCGWLPEKHHADLQPCVRIPDHNGKHCVWRQGAIDVVMWLVDDSGHGEELFRGRIGRRGAQPLKPLDALTMYEAAAGFAEELAAE
jgi:hypothetical protein